MKRLAIVEAVLILAAILVGAIAAYQFNLSALPDPGRMETRLATRAKRFFIRRASREGSLPAPADTPASRDNGGTLFGTECSECHGASGQKPTDAGRWMYPRAANLASPEVQNYSDVELFWIVKNGIRLSGMPAFGNVETEEHIWDLVHFLRTLHASLPARSR